jgi:cysteine desulfurase
MLYLDHAATTPLRPEAREAMAPFFDDAFGNPSGVHGVARRARNAVEDARERAAALLEADHPLEIVFTGGGTEADNLALAGPALAGTGRTAVVVTAVEHDAILATAAFLARLGHSVDVIGVDAHGRVDPEAVAAAVRAETAVVSVMAANNETGIRQPVRDVVAAVRAVSSEALVHTDAVQAFPAEEVSVPALGADLITLASHKVGGPKGVGLLYVRTGTDLEPVIHGGGQELGRRSGTHNVAGIVGMVAALEAAAADRQRFRRDVAEARRRFETHLRAALDAAVTGAPADRLPQHSHLHLPGVDAESLLIRLDRAGVAASAGSACHSGATHVSHVPAAMGIDPQRAAQSVRFSFGWTSVPGDGDTASRIVAAQVEEMR